MSDAANERGVAQLLWPEQVAAQVAALPLGARWLGILTGWRGAGKSTWCAALAHAAHSYGLSVAGVFSRAVFSEESLPLAERVKVRIDLVDFATGSARVLATPTDAASETHGLRWHFREETVAWGNTVLEVATADLLIIDELGPLELTHARGLTAGLALLDKRRYSCAVAVIRPELLETALTRWPGAEVFTVPEWR